eukprot:512206-Ditylum_brightwellii.AAC.1
MSLNILPYLDLLAPAISITTRKRSLESLTTLSSLLPIAVGWVHGYTPSKLLDQLDHVVKSFK